MLACDLTALAPCHTSIHLLEIDIIVLLPDLACRLLRHSPLLTLLVLQDEILYHLLFSLSILVPIPSFLS